MASFGRNFVRVASALLRNAKSCTPAAKQTVVFLHSCSQTKAIYSKIPNKQLNNLFKSCTSNGNANSVVKHGPITTAVAVKCLTTSQPHRAMAQDIETMKDKTDELTALIRKLKEENKIDIQQVKQSVDQAAGAAGPTLGNPAAVGLAGFGLNTLLLQFHNLGYMAGVGAVVWSGLILGGTAQLIAGLQEYQNGNNFGYSAFTTYGAFWIALCLMWMGDKLDLWKTTAQEKAWFFVVFTIYTAGMTLGAAKISMALFTTFVQLLAGFVALDFHLFYPEVKEYQTAAGVVLSTCALNALYCMMNIIMTPLFKRPMFPVGKPPL